MATRKKAPKKTVPEAPVVQEVTKAQEIWDKISSLPLDLFALPNQIVSKHVEREKKLEKVYPNVLHLKLKSQAVLPALEDALGKVRLPKDENGLPQVFVVDKGQTYTTVKIVPRT